MNGTPRPFGDDRPKGKGGITALAVGGALVIGASGVGGLGGLSAGSGTAVESLGSLSGRVKSGKESARKGRPDEAWRRMSLRSVKKATDNALDCAVNSYGQVRDFFSRTPCKSLDRAFFTFADEQGNSFVVSVSWVTMYDRQAVDRLKVLADKDGTGNVKPVGFDALKSQGVRFTGEPYKSRDDGKRLVIAEAATTSGDPDPALVRGTVEVAVELR
ncbi:MAG: hypothetical protein M3548_08015 [Actinomycetota bacterium]|nr:hypothetical protein [Actinomycetota bacterium]